MQGCLCFFCKVDTGMIDHVSMCVHFCLYFTVYVILIFVTGLYQPCDIISSAEQNLSVIEVTQIDSFCMVFKNME